MDRGDLALLFIGVLLVVAAGIAVLAA